MTSPMTGSFLRLAAAAGVFVIVLAACTTSGAGTSAGQTAAASAVATSSAAASAPASSGGGKYGGEGDGGGSGTRSPSPSASAEDSVGEVYEVDVGNGADGAYLTGEDGRTLYVFGNDSANASTCDGDCATAWPPFILADDDTLKAGDGVKGKLAAFTRTDGAMQVAYDGSPLYYYSADTAAGDTKGQGFGDVWFIAKP